MLGNTVDDCCPIDNNMDRWTWWYGGEMLDDIEHEWKGQCSRERLTCSAAAKTTCACGHGGKAVKEAFVREGDNMMTGVHIRAGKVFIRGAGDVAKTTCVCGRGNNMAEEAFVRGGGNMVREATVRAEKIFVRGADDMAKTTCVCGHGDNVAKEAFVRGGGNMVREAAIRAGKIFIRGVGGTTRRWDRGGTMLHVVDMRL